MNKIKWKSERLTNLTQIEGALIPTISNGNSKTGKACLTISMDRDFVCQGMPCYKACYCNKGRQQYWSVRNAYIKNYLLWNNPTTRDNYKLYIDTAIKTSGLSLVRHFDAGDIPDIEYVDFMNELAVSNPNVSFLCYTKKYALVNTWLDNNILADNLCIRFSHWDKDWGVFNPHQLPTAHVKFTDTAVQDDIPQCAVGCLNQQNKQYTCSTCKRCFNKNIQAIVFKQH